MTILKSTLVQSHLQPWKYQNSYMKYSHEYIQKQVLGEQIFTRQHNRRFILTVACIANIAIVVSDSAHPTYLKPIFVHSVVTQICVVAPKWAESARCHFRFTALLFAVYGPFTAYLYWESFWVKFWVQIEFWVTTLNILSISCSRQDCDEICSWVCIHCDDIGATLHNSIWSYCSFKLHNSIIY